MLLSKCPTCGSKELRQKTIDHEVKGGNNIAFVEISAEVCGDCGETLFTEDQVRLFEKVRDQLKKNDIKNFIQVGNTFRLAS